MKSLKDLVRAALRLKASDPEMDEALCAIGTRVVRCTDPLLIAAADAILQDLSCGDSSLARGARSIPFPARAIAVGVAIVGDDGRFYFHASPTSSSEGHGQAQIALAGATQALASAVADHIKIHTIGDWQ